MTEGGGSRHQVGDQSTTNLGEEKEEENFLHKYVKSIVYGGLDGIITTFAVVAGVQGADLSAEVILALGFGNLLADAISMGAGDFLSDKAELDLAVMEQKKIESKLGADSSRKSVINNLIDSYVTNYEELGREDATALVQILGKNDDLLINHYMRECDGSDPPDFDNSPMVSGLVTMGSFVLFGFVPLVAYVIYELFGLNSEDGSQTAEFIITICLTLLTMCVLGAVQGRVTGGHSPSSKDVMKTALFVTGNGAAAAIASYLVSWAVAEIVGIRE